MIIIIIYVYVLCYILYILWVAVFCYLYKCCVRFELYNNVMLFWHAQAEKLGRFLKLFWWGSYLCRKGLISNIFEWLYMNSRSKTVENGENLLIFWMHTREIINIMFIMSWTSMFNEVTFREILLPYLET